MKPQLVRTGSRTARLGWLLVGLALLAPLASPAHATRIGPWLNSTFNTQYWLPTMPNTNDAATFVIAGRFPWACGSVVDTRVIDMDHVAMTFRFSTGCVDSARNWHAEFPLGYLPEGHRDLLLLLTVERPDSAAVLDSSYFSYDVMGNGPTPPPPPPPPPPGADLIEGWQSEPVHPHPGDDVRIHVWGNAPFDCPAVEGESIGGDLILQATLAPHPGCSDTLRFWSHDFDLGQLPDGNYSSLILVHVSGDTLTARANYAISVNDSITAPPPPAPPPTDSLNAVLSATKPNPFAAQTQFSVSVEDAVPADVAIFDLLGRRVATVFRGTLPAGTSQLVWNGRREDGSRAPGGLYFYRLTMPGRVVSRRVVRLSPGN